jgi:hypothetical protein
MRVLVTILLFLQAGGSPKLRDFDREHLLRSDSFTMVSAVQDLPEYVKHSFAKITHDSTFFMANPGEEFQVTDVVEKEGLPSRRLIVAGISTDHCFLHYEMGGIGHAYYIVLFRLKEGKARFVWGSSAWEGYQTLDSLRKAIASEKFDDSFPFIW